MISHAQSTETLPAVGSAPSAEEPGESDPRSLYLHKEALLSLVPREPIGAQDAQQ